MRLNHVSSKSSVWSMHIAQATECTMAFVVAIMTCLSGRLAICMRTLLEVKQFHPTCAKMFEAVHITIVTQL